MSWDSFDVSVMFERMDGLHAFTSTTRRHRRHARPTVDRRDLAGNGWMSDAAETNRSRILMHPVDVHTVEGDAVVISVDKRGRQNGQIALAVYPHQLELVDKTRSPLEHLRRFVH